MSRESVSCSVVSFFLFGSSEVRKHLMQWHWTGPQLERLTCARGQSTTLNIGNPYNGVYNQTPFYCENDSFSEIIILNRGKCMELKGNYYRKDPFFTVHHDSGRKGR